MQARVIRGCVRSTATNKSGLYRLSIKDFGRANKERSFHLKDNISSQLRSVAQNRK